MRASTGTTFRAGDLVSGRFRIVRFIASGGMGELYEAHDLELKEQVALKTIRPDIAADVRVNQRFRREVQLARKITHPNICRIFDLFQHQPASEAAAPPVVFVTMELLEGETLRDLMKRQGRFTVQQALPLALQMAEALAAAHAVGIVHRDFKSNNVMILPAKTPGDSPRAVVTDFGLAYTANDDEAATNISISAPGDILGTPDYMAPEQIQGGDVTPASDVYALGIVLYEMVTGVRPFAASTPMASALKRISGPPPQTPRDLVQDIPVDWNTVIMRCLERNPEKRFPDGAAVAAALKPVEGIAQPKNRNRVTALLVLGSVILAIGAAVTWFELRPKPATPVSVQTPAAVARPVVAVLGFRNSTGREDTQWLSLALAEMLTTELAASESLRTVPGENINRMKMELKLADADSFGPETVTRIKQNLGTDFTVSGSYVTVGDGAATTLRIDIRLQDSRDGRTIASLGETGKATEVLDVVSRAGGRLRERLGVELNPDSLASIRASESKSPDAARLYAEGLMRLRRFDAVKARELLERAIQIDPNFVLPHSALANTWSALGYDDRARQAAQRAFELSASLPRADRLQVEATYREMSKSWKEAIAAWQSLVNLFPDDIEHTLHLANAQITSGAPKEGVATIDRFKKRFPATKDPRLDLASAGAAETLSDFKGMQSLAASAVASAEAQGAGLLVAGAKLRLASALLRQGKTEQAMPFLDEARRLYEDAGDRVGVARVLNNAGAAMSNGSDTQRPIALYEEGLAIARAAGNQDLVARLLNNIAIQYRRTGDFQASLRMNQESLAIRREIGDRTNAAVSLNNIGNVLLDLGDAKGAAEHYEQSADMSREIGDRRGLARVLYNASQSLKIQGQITRARSTAEEALKLRRSIDDPVSLASSLDGLGEIAALQGDLSTAKPLLVDGLELNRRLGTTRQIGYSLYNLGNLTLIQGDLAGAQRQHQEGLEIRTQSGEKGTAAESRVALASIALEQGRAAEAELLARDATATFEEQHATDNEATARANLALALFLEGKRDPALREVERARALVRNTQNALARMWVSIASARIGAGNNSASALSQMDALRSEALKQGLPRYEFEARRAIVTIEGRDSAAGAAHLASLQKDAKARGFLLYAR